MNDSSVQSSSPNRWVIAGAAFLMQLALGAVYAWSVFLPKVMTLYGVSKVSANATFSITLVALGITAGFGGYLNSRFGPRTIAMVAGTLYGLGVFLASFVSPNIILLYLTYGVIGGIGLGLGYIVALAMLIKWFPRPARVHYRPGRCRVWFRSRHHRADCLQPAAAVVEAEYYLPCAGYRLLRRSGSGGAILPQSAGWLRARWLDALDAAANDSFGA